MDQQLCEIKIKFIHNHISCWKTYGESTLKYREEERHKCLICARTLMQVKMLKEIIYCKITACVGMISIASTMLLCICVYVASADTCVYICIVGTTSNRVEMCWRKGHVQLSYFQVSHLVIDHFVYSPGHLVYSIPYKRSIVNE